MGDLFNNVRFFITEQSDAIKDLLINEGARHINYLSENVTHVIADRVCPGAEEAVELFDKPVVKSSWVRLCLKTRKLWPTEAFSPFNTTFVDVVAFFSTDLSPTDTKNLQAVITANGGRLTGNLASATHLIATSNIEQVGKFKIVAPDWIYDSLAAKRCCDEKLYDPKLLLSPPPAPTPKKPSPTPVLNAQPQQQQFKVPVSANNEECNIYSADQIINEIRGKSGIPLNGARVSLTNFKRADRLYIKEIVKMTGAIPTDEFTKKHDLLICRIFGGEKSRRAVEWQIPIVEIPFDGITREATNESEMVIDEPSECDENTSPMQPVIKDRTSTTPVRITFTRLKPKLQSRLEEYATKLEFSLASSPLDCTHLIVDKISRSPKFMCAFSNCEFILSYRWIIDSHQYGKPLDEIPYILQDKEGEREYSFNLARSMMKRRKRNSPLFRDYTFFVTKTVTKQVANLVEIIRSAGGEVETRKLPTGDQISQIRERGQRLVIVADKQDFYLFDDIEIYGVDIVSFEFVLSGILRQDIEFDYHRLIRAPTA